MGYAWATHELSMRYPLWATHELSMRYLLATHALPMRYPQETPMDHP